MSKNIITGIVIHNSDSDFGNVSVIRGWHLERGWSDIGYHFVIQNGRIASNFVLPVLDGHIEMGRPIDGNKFLDAKEKGAHAYGLNSSTVGICLIGKRLFTSKQKSSLDELVTSLCIQWSLGADNVIGHYESPNANGKTCPNFDMQEFRDHLKMF